MPNRRSTITRTLSVLAGLALVRSSLTSQQADYTFRAQTELVLVNVTVRDKTGNLVPNLKREDFTVLEDNKPQQVVSFDIENIDRIANQDVAQVRPLADAASRPSATTTSRNDSQPLKDHRLIVLFFDLSAMQPDE